MSVLRVPRVGEQVGASEETDGIVITSISSEILEGIKRLALSAGVPLKSALLAAHMRVLAAIANQDDSQTGLVTNGRLEEDGGERVIGLFLNTVPFRLPISDVSWEKLAQQAFRAESELLPHRRFPLAEIQSLASGERVFETGFNFVHFHATQALATIEGLSVVGVKVFERHNYTLAVIFSIDPFTGLLTVNLVHDRAAISATHAQRIAAYYQRTLAAMVEAPQSSCLAFSPLSAEERAQILLASRGAPAMDLPDKLAHEVFDEVAARMPDALAVVAPGKTPFTYRDLAARTNRLAHSLRSKGIGVGDRVGVFLPRSVELVIGFLAILKAGGTYLPLDPSYPPERLAYMLDDARPRLILTTHAHAPGLAEQDTHVVLIDETTHWLDFSPESPERIVNAEDPAYIIYTSGTTGKPRGVLVPHRGLPNLAAAQIATFGVKPESRVLQFASPNFDASVSEFLMALLSGAALVLPRPEAHQSADVLLTNLRDERITHVTLPPSLLAVFPETELPALSSLILAGEACPPALATRWGKNRRFLDAYGPTETTVCATIAEITEADTRGSSLPIGKPMAGAEVYLLDERFTPVPLGTPGEICIGGIGVALGYLNQPELSQAKFVANPLGPGKLYRSGDIGRMRTDGNIEFLGRKDEQIKLRGFRVEPEEIRAVLNEHPEVRDSIVIARESPGVGKQLVAYVAKNQSGGSELWPSTFEFLIYDELLYHAMTTDDQRVARYKEAIEKLVPGRVVVEIGTGPHAVLTALCARAGAKKVYSIEIDPATHRTAKERIESMGLSGVVELICGDARKVELPEPADVCVSAIIGAIGGTEGAAVILNDARRFLREGGTMLPERVTTRIAAISLPDSVREKPQFSDVGRHYAKKIFDHVGRRFDVRLCISKVSRDNHLSRPDVFEDLDFSTEVPVNEEHRISLPIEKAGRFDGFLVGADVVFAPGVSLDLLFAEQNSQLPVYLPIFDPPADVEPGDEIVATCCRTLSENGIHPDFEIRGKLVRKNGSEIAFQYVTRQLETRYKATPFYRRLFEHEERVEGSPVQTNGAERDLRKFLRQKLPDYMIPAHIVELSELPRTKAGKIDRRALPNPEAKAQEKRAVLPESELEREIADIWKEVLKLQQVGIDDNFFDLGGHSLLLMIVLGKLQETRSETIEIVELFEHPTIRSLANHLRSRNLGERQIVPKPVEAKPAVSAEEIKQKRLAARDARRQARQAGRG